MSAPWWRLGGRDPSVGYSPSVESPAVAPNDVDAARSGGEGREVSGGDGREASGGEGERARRARLTASPPQMAPLQQRHGLTIELRVP